MAEGVINPALSEAASTCAAIGLCKEDPVDSLAETDDVVVLYERVPKAGLSKLETNNTRKHNDIPSCLPSEGYDSEHRDRKRIKHQPEETVKKCDIDGEYNNAVSDGRHMETTAELGDSGESYNRTESKDNLYRFMETKVRIMQKDTICEKANRIQEAVAENLKYFLKELEKIEPMFRVSELIQVGSFAEGTKIDKPNEFDFLAIVEVLSREGTIVVEKNQSNSPGCVSLTLKDNILSTELIGLCEKGELQCFHGTSVSESFHFKTAKFGKKFIDAVRNVFMAKVFKLLRPGVMTMCDPMSMHIPGRLILPAVNGISLLLRNVEFKTPNIVLDYEYEGLEIGVDLSPAVRYHNIEDCIDPDKCTSPEIFEAIRDHGSVLFVGNKLGGFRTTVTECEVKYMCQTIQKGHKILYIFLKYLCHILHHMEPPTSFMLKQMCIQHDVNCRSELEPFTECFGKFIEDMIIHYDKREIPAMHNKDVNIYSFKPVPLIGDHSNLHFILVLRALYHYSNETSTVEGFEAILNDAIDKLSKKYWKFIEKHGMVYDTQQCQSFNHGLREGIHCPVCDSAEERFQDDIAQSSECGVELSPCTAGDHSPNSSATGAKENSTTKRNEQSKEVMKIQAAKPEIKKNTNQTSLVNEHEQSEVLRCLPAADVSTCNSSRAEHTDQSKQGGKTLLCLPDPTVQHLTATGISSREKTDEVYVLYERVPRVTLGKGNVGNNLTDVKQAFRQINKDKPHTVDENELRPVAASLSANSASSRHEEGKTMLCLPAPDAKQSSVIDRSCIENTEEVYVLYERVPGASSCKYEARDRHGCSQEGIILSVLGNNQTNSKQETEINYNDDANKDKPHTDDEHELRTIEMKDAFSRIRLLQYKKMSSVRREEIFRKQ